jgi:hypothetical protein
VGVVLRLLTEIAKMTRLGKLGLVVFVMGLGLAAVCQAQQSAGCQPQDYANIGAEIAATEAKMQAAAGSAGLTQDAIQSIVDGYTAKRVELAATNCGPSKAKAVPATAQAGAKPVQKAKSKTTGVIQAAPAIADAHPGPTPQKQPATLTQFQQCAQANRLMRQNMCPLSQ